MSRKNLTLILSIFLIATSLSSFLFWKGFSIQNEFQIPQVSEKTEPPLKEASESSLPKDLILGEATASSEPKFKVTKVVDGDTIEVDYFGQRKKLRYIGINTPETVDPRRSVQCFGKEASNENKDLILGKEVYLEKDVSETDKFGRLLRYVYLKVDDKNKLFVNDYLVREGFAEVDTYPPDVKYNERFLNAQKEARDNKKGLWQKCK